MLLASTTAIIQKRRPPSSVRVTWRIAPWSHQFLMVFGCTFAKLATSEAVNKAGIWSIGQKCFFVVMIQIVGYNINACSLLF
jgi:hypothetical protein